jgi:transposase InsO family protein
VADFTYVRCWQRMTFFSFILDIYSRMTVGWQFATHMRTSLVQDALQMAVGHRRPGGDVAVVHHSDRGSLTGLKRSSEEVTSDGDGLMSRRERAACVGRRCSAHPAPRE